MKKTKIVAVPNTPAREKKVSEMSIGDVLKTQTMFGVVKMDLDYLRKTRDNDVLQSQIKGVNLKHSTVDDLQHLGLMEPGAFIVKYAQICDKKPLDLDLSVKQTIIEVGNVAFHKAMKILISKENEATRKNSNGVN